MTLGELLKAGVIDENEVVVVINFEGGKNEEVLFVGYLHNIYERLLNKKVMVGAMSEKRRQRYGNSRLAIFINE